MFEFGTFGDNITPGGINNVCQHETLKIMPVKAAIFEAVVKIVPGFSIKTICNFLFLLSNHPMIWQMQISIIIPAYNEAKNIAGLITYLIQNKTEDVAEIIIVDGGSNDDTVHLAITAGAVAVISPSKGRAAQMNYGAAMAKGDILYFIHADTFPPASFTYDILNAVHQGFKLGRYYTKFDSDKWYLKINAWFTRFDWFICMGGDNTLFVVRKVFENAGGFKQEMRIMEEYEFCNRLRKSGAAYKILKNTALVSARKYEGKSWLKVQLANRKIIRMYRKGDTQEAMVETYKRMLQNHD